MKPVIVFPQFPRKRNPETLLAAALRDGWPSTSKQAAAYHIHALHALPAEKRQPVPVLLRVLGRENRFPEKIVKYCPEFTG